MKLQKGAAIVIVLIMSLFILGCTSSKKLSLITGKAIYEEEEIHSENLNIVQNESGVYEWEVKNPGNIKSVKATGSVSTNGSAKVYIDKNGTRYLLFDSTKQLFDVSIYVIPEYKQIPQGGKILVEITIFNLRGFGRVDVSVEYFIKDLGGTTILTEHETIAVETQAKFTRTFTIPSDLKPGTYMVYAKVTYGNSVGSSSDLFDVKAKSIDLFPSSIKDYKFALAISLIAALLFLIFLLPMRQIKIPRGSEIKQLGKELRLKQLKNELQSLEKAHRSGFVSKESYQKQKDRISSEMNKKSREL